MTIRHLYPAVEPSLNLDFANSKKLDPRITFTRASTGTYVGADGLIKTAAVNEARFDHDSDGNSLGLLIEESRTNRILYSSNVGNASYYTLSNATAAFNTNLAPDGTFTATKLISGTASNTASYAQTGGIFLGESSVTVTIFAKAAGHNYLGIQGGEFAPSGIIYNLSNGTIASNPNSRPADIVAYPNGWYRCRFGGYHYSSTYNWKFYTTSSSSSFVITGDGSSGIYIWGAQLEQGSFPTSYIPTTSSTVTRSADVASMTGTNFSSWYNQSEGTFAVTATRKSSPTGMLFSLYTSTTDRIEVSFGDYAVPNSVQTYVVPSIGINAQIFSAGALPGSRVKYAASFATNSLNAVINGGTVTSSSSMGMPSPISMSIGYRGSYSDYHLNNTISRLTYYPVRLPDATLQALTL